MMMQLAKLAVLMSTAALLACAYGKREEKQDDKKDDKKEPVDQYCNDPDPTGVKLGLLAHYADGLLGAPSDAGWGPGAAAEIADLDHDDVLDVVETRGHPHEPGAILIYYGNRSSGEFELDAPVVLHRGPTYSQGALGDLDRDGCLDLVVGFEKLEPEPNGGVHVFMAERTTDADRLCRFRREPLTLMRSPVLPDDDDNDDDDDPFGVADVALGDYDADGELDLAVAQVYTRPDYRKPLAQSIYLRLGDRLGCAPAGTCPKPIVTNTAIAGNSSVEFLDVNRNGRLDLLFAGSGTSTWTTWGVVKLDDGTEFEIRREFQITQPSRIPHVVDLEVLPQNPTVPNNAQVAVLFGRHDCSSGCGDRASAYVFELPSFDTPDATSPYAEQLWTSRHGCRGDMTRIAAGRLGGDEHLDLVFGWVDTASSEGVGKLIVVEGRDGAPHWEPIKDAEHASAARYENQSFGSWVLEISDLDGSDTTDETQQKSGWTGQRVVELPDVIHHAPHVTCDGAPRSTSFTPGTNFIILAEGCGSSSQPESLVIKWKKERAGDILYIVHDPDPQKRTLRRLRYHPIP